MTEVKIPKPDTHCFDTDTGLDVWSYSEKQLKQYGDDRAREALEMAAKEAERMTMYTGGRQEAPAHETVWHAARSIRALAKEIK